MIPLWLEKVLLVMAVILILSGIAVESVYPGKWIAAILFVQGAFLGAWWCVEAKARKGRSNG